jgi:polyribonucleotide nucleotidyltransferase
LPKSLAHGSSLFTRGDTQVLSVSTIGKISERQTIDGIFGKENKTFMHHYNFPQFAVNEISSPRGVTRREIGHGELVEKTFSFLIPKSNVFPYTIRSVSEVLSSDGSSSQASVCATSMSLMAAGIPLKNPAAGIALGLLGNNIYTDLNAMEDKLGDMDFKIAGTKKGICSMQMDVKNKGIDSKILENGLSIATNAINEILIKIEGTVTNSKNILPEQVLKCCKYFLKSEKRGIIIGPKGKNINQIREKTGSVIEMQGEEDFILIYNKDENDLQRTIRMIEDLISSNR